MARARITFHSANATDDEAALLADAFRTRIENVDGVRVVTEVSATHGSMGSEWSNDLALAALAVYAAFRDEQIKSIVAHLVEALKLRSSNRVKVEITTEGPAGRRTTMIDAQGSSRTVRHAVEDALKNLQDIEPHGDKKDSHDDTEGS